MSGEARRRGGETLVEFVRRSLEEDIIDGRLLPGSRLDEKSLAARFQVSRTPVREALRQLVASELAESRPHRGVVVSLMTQQRLVELFEASAELEASCGRLAARRMRPHERHALQALHATMRHHVSAGESEAYIRLNHDFHARIYAGAHNEPLSSLALATRRRVAPFRRAQFMMLGRLSHSFAEHDEIVAAILRGDGAAAATALRTHMMAAHEAAAEFLVALSAGQLGGAGKPAPRHDPDPTPSDAD